MRKILLFIIAVHLLNSSKAQLLKPGNQGIEFSQKLNIIIIAFSNNFYQIQGEALKSDQERDIFRSSVQVPGSINNVIYRFNSSKDTSASWQAIMFSGEEYVEALKIYRQTSRLLNKCRINLQSSTPAGFKGKFIEPDPTLSFAQSSFKLQTEDKIYAAFFAEIELLNTGMNWEVRLNLHNKKDDAEIF